MRPQKYSSKQTLHDIKSSTSINFNQQTKQFLNTQDMIDFAWNGQSFNLNLKSPSTKQACTELGINIKELKIKKYEEFLQGDLAEAISKVRYQHYNNLLARKLTDIEQQKRDINQRTKEDEYKLKIYQSNSSQQQVLTIPQIKHSVFYGINQSQTPQFSSDRLNSMGKFKEVKIQPQGIFKIFNTTLNKVRSCKLNRQPQNYEKISQSIEKTTDGLGLETEFSNEL